MAQVDTWEIAIAAFDFEYKPQSVLRVQREQFGGLQPIRNSLLNISECAQFGWERFCTFV